MDGFEWAENNLGVSTPQELQGKGVDVFFAPNVSPGSKVVNLADGRVNWFEHGQPPPASGYFAAYDSLEQYCREQGLPLTETNGVVSSQPIGFGEAGDPLEHGGA